MKTRVAIFISGSGSNMVELVRSMGVDHPATPVLVLSNVPGARGLDKARAMGIATCVVDHRPYGNDRAGFEAEIEQHLATANVDIICTAGFMRILTPDFVNNRAGRILNIHPSLLPMYKGLHTHARAIAAGDTHGGCSVHLVTSELDGGPVLGRSKVEIEAGDTPDTLAARVLKQEHKLYPMVLRQFIVDL